MKASDLKIGMTICIPGKDDRKITSIGSLVYRYTEGSEQFFYEDRLVWLDGWSPVVDNYSVDFIDDEEDEVKASDVQVAGNHYSKLKIQPMQYCLENNLNYGQSNTIKYITRYKDKNGIEDLKKAIHCIELLIEFEEKQ